MTAIDRDKLRLALTQVIQEQDPSLPQRLGADDSAPLDLIAVTAAVAEEASQLLSATVASARRGDSSWARIGTELGVTRQAAQQRFAQVEPQTWSVYSAQVTRPPESWRLSPLTAVNEMSELERMGRQGWHSVGFGAGYHDVVPSEVQWEHLRTTVFNRQPTPADGWQRIGMWFPFVYYARPTGQPAETA